MNVLITGNMGYVGTNLCQYLNKNYPNINITGFDTCFFGHLITGSNIYPDRGVSIQYFGDIRDIQKSVLRGVDAVVHLAGVSNDPIGQEFKDVTIDINRNASLRLIRMCIEENIKNFVFASSCSIYGQAGNLPRKEEDIKNPLTAYASSKLGTEEEIKNIDLGKLTFTSLRFATACGWSNRLRLDLVLNDFVTSALTSGKITILSDGTSWRPLIDVEDMARAIFWGINRDSNHGGQNLSINVGKNSHNFQVKNIAETVAKLIPNTKIFIKDSTLKDQRSYIVDFKKYEKLAPSFLPIISLEESIIRIKTGLLSMKFNDSKFRDSSLIRLNAIRKLIKDTQINNSLYWNS